MTTKDDRRRRRLLNKLRCPGCGAVRYLGRDGLVCPECAATKRSRLFIIARRGRSRADIPWPEPTHAGAWRPAYEVIDWSKPCPSIFSRKRPLAEKTLRRIEIGLRKFVGEAAEPFVVRLRQHGNGESTSEPLGTITAGGQHHGLAVPYLVKYHGGTNPNRDGTERSHDMRATP